MRGSNSKDGKLVGSASNAADPFRKRELELRNRLLQRQLKQQQQQLQGLEHLRQERRQKAKAGRVQTIPTVDSQKKPTFEQSNSSSSQGSSSIGSTTQVNLSKTSTCLSPVSSSSSVSSPSDLQSGSGKETPFAPQRNHQVPSLTSSTSSLPAQLVQATPQVVTASTLGERSIPATKVRKTLADSSIREGSPSFSPNSSHSATSSTAASDEEAFYEEEEEEEAAIHHFADSTHEGNTEVVDSDFLDDPNSACPICLEPCEHPAFVNTCFRILFLIEMYCSGK